MGIMGNSLVATTALAFAGALAAGSASAADKLSVGVGGYMEQWVGMVDLDSGGSDGGVGQISDSEVHIKGKLESDNGLTFSVKVEIEGNGDGSIDESQATIGGSFGQIVLGAEDNARTLTHYGHQDVGIGLNCGDVGAWVSGFIGCAAGFETAGHGHGDRKAVTYFTPRLSGVQFGATYIPNADSAAETGNVTPENNDRDAWAVGLNVQQSFGDANIAFSIGHRQASQVGAEKKIFDGAKAGGKPTDPRGVSVYTAADHEGDEAAWKKFEDWMAKGGAPGTIATDAGMAKERIEKHQVAAMKADENTFTNFGLQVGFGAFGFNVAYATRDGGAYKPKRNDKVIIGQTNWDPDGPKKDYDGEDDNDDDIPQTVVNNPGDDIVMSRLEKDKSKDYDVMSVGVKYTQGPMAVSLGYMATDFDNGDESEATMLSMSYTLAPGVASKTSLLTAEQGEIEGTAFVTGITLSF